MEKYVIHGDVAKKIDAIEKAYKKQLDVMSDIYRTHKDKLIEDSLSLQRGLVYRHREGGQLDYRGYYRGVVDGRIQLEICLADGTLTGKFFSQYWERSISYLEDVKLK